MDYHRAFCSKELPRTYRYFGEPVYIYSPKEGINDGFLTPFKVKRIKTTLDDYIYTSDDQVIEGEVEEGKLYKEADFNKIIEIKEREAKRVQIMLSEINQSEKAIVFCATQDHAAAVRDLINQYKKSSDPFYCVRVTANDGAFLPSNITQSLTPPKFSAALTLSEIPSSTSSSICMRRGPHRSEGNLYDGSNTR